LNKRTSQILSDLGNHPNASIPAACKGRAEMQAAYRYFGNENVTFEKVLAPHRQRTLERISRHETVLLVQDTSEIDLSRPASKVKGVGDLDGVRDGILLHEMQAFTTEGTPLGTVWAQCINRITPKQTQKKNKRPRRKVKPIEQKESMRWLSGIRQGAEIAAQQPDVHLIAIADSDADIYECLCELPEQDRAGQLDWIVRGCQDRALHGQSAHLLEKVLETKVLYIGEVEVRQRKAKIEIGKGKGKRKRRHQSRQARTARIEVRAASVLLRAPARPDRDLPPVRVNVVLVREVNAPDGQEPLEWMLLTTLPIDTMEQVRTVVLYYAKRWGIELFFKMLKSGCRIEERRFEDIERVLPYLAMSLIIAWRTMYAAHLGRECPDLECEMVFETSEWKAVWVATNQTKPPTKPPSLRQMVHMIATLGGYIESPKREPGIKTMWIGMQRMYDLAWAWDTFGPGAKNLEKVV
jgi:hypothetical protein